MYLLSRCWSWEVSLCFIVSLCAQALAPIGSVMLHFITQRVVCWSERHLKRIDVIPDECESWSVSVVSVQIQQWDLSKSVPWFRVVLVCRIYMTRRKGDLVMSSLNAQTSNSGICKYGPWAGSDTRELFIRAAGILSKIISKIGPVLSLIFKFLKQYSKIFFHTNTNFGRFSQQ
jgi:hypothetical protein